MPFGISSDLADATFRARLDAIYALAVPMTAMDLLGTYMIAWCYWDPSTAAGLAAWFLACIAAMTARTGMAFAYRSGFFANRPPQFWARSLIVFGMLTGSLWGGAIGWMMATGNGDQVSFALCVALAGVALSVAHISFWPFYATYAAPVTLGAATGFALSDRPGHFLLAFGALAMTVGLLVTTRRLAQEVLRAYRLAEENSALVENLADRGAELERALAALEQVSRTDPLTGLANRRWRDDRLASEWRRAARQGGWLTVIAIDVDCFKAFNDVHGHDEGDRCLKSVADAIRAETRSGVDLAARQGGEEFMLILPGMRGEDAAMLGERVRRRVANCWHAAGLAQQVTVSVGIASCEPSRSGSSISTLSRAADAALYRAKVAGRNRCEVADMPGDQANVA